MSHLPVPDPESAPYWDAAAEGRLVFQRCRQCDHAYLYPRAACPRCWSSDPEWVDTSGRGHVYSFTVVHRNDLPPFRDRLPYLVAVVELEEGPRLATNLVECDPADVWCGMAVRVAFREETDGEGSSVRVPVFRPVADPG
jgi:uncharacterized OB-fold protein